MSDCIFCRIATKEAKATLVEETPEYVAFEDIHPQAPAHTLLIPREHIPTLNDLRPDQAPLIGRMVLAAREIARRKGIAESGYRLLANCNAHGGQAVYHLHFHLLGGKPLGAKLCS